MMTYNGYTNYETWCLCLWIDNDQGLQETVSELVRSQKMDDGSAAQALKDFIEEAAPDLGATLWADLLTSAISEINWQEAAGQYTETD